MSSAIYVTFDEDDHPGDEPWRDFCTEQGLVHSPQTVGGKTWYDTGIGLGRGEVEVTRDTPAQVTFSTYFMGPAMPRVAATARAFWLRFGGQVEAAEELRPLFAAGR